MSFSSDEPITLLGLDPIGIQPFSARGITQTLLPIQASAQLRRTVNGSLLDLSAPQFRKYQSSLACSDQSPPSFDSVFPGAILRVDCIARLSYKTEGGSPSRDTVPGSDKVDGDFTSFRPRLQMRVVNFNIQEDEYGATVGWSLDLEEI